MKLLILGNKGQLGRELCELSNLKGIAFEGCDMPEFDITNQSQVSHIIADSKPAMVVNAAAYTAVERAEAEKEIAFAVNKNGPVFVSDECHRQGIPLIHISTDYVFSGSATTPYVETDDTMPINIYGASKAAGEEEVSHRMVKYIIIRTSWLYGIYGTNFVKTIIKMARERELLTVVDDQFGCPTYARDLADAILIIATKYDQNIKFASGILHYCNEGVTTWYEFAREIVRMAFAYEVLKVKNILPIKTKDYKTAAKRPQYSVLDCRRIKESYGITQKPWGKSLADMIERMYANHALQ